MIYNATEAFSDLTDINITVLTLLLMLLAIFDNLLHTEFNLPVVPVLNK